jgi:hypothetical protein
MGLARQVQVVAVAAATGQQTQILAPPHGLTDTAPARSSVHQRSIIVMAWFGPAIHESKT